jgi:hypothetical protein
VGYQERRYGGFLFAFFYLTVVAQDGAFPRLARLVPQHEA